MYLSSKALIKKKTIVNVKKLNNVPMKPSQLNKVAARREREKRKGILFLSWEDEWEKSTRSRIFFIASPWRQTFVRFTVSFH